MSQVRENHQSKTVHAFYDPAPVTAVLCPAGICVIGSVRPSAGHVPLALTRGVQDGGTQVLVLKDT